MKKIILPAFLMLLSVFAFAQTGEKNFIDQPYIEVNGTAELEIVPDMIYLKIMISEADTKGKISLESLEKKMKTHLTDIGIDVAKELSVGDLSSSYTKYFLQGKDVSTSREYVLLVHDAAMAGKSVKALSEDNISNISVLKIDHSQMAQKRFDLRLEAVKAAKGKAEAMANVVGQKAGKAIFMTENNDIIPFLQSNVSGVMSMGQKKFEDLTEPELLFKNITIRSGVLVRFVIN